MTNSLYRFETSNGTCFISMDDDTHDLVDDNDWKITKNIIMVNTHCDACQYDGIYSIPSVSDSHDVMSIHETMNGLFLFISMEGTNIDVEYVLFPAKLYDDENKRQYEYFQQHLMCYKCKGGF